MPPRLPIVGIPCDHRTPGGHPFHMAGEKYIAAIRDGAGALPLLVPVLTPPIPPDEILAGVDGLLFTGSPSNVRPRAMAARRRAKACCRTNIAMRPRCRCSRRRSRAACRCCACAAAFRN